MGIDIHYEYLDEARPLLHESEYRDLMAGREEESGKIKKYVLQNNIIIYGTRGIGKSTLMNWTYRYIKHTYNGRVALIKITGVPTKWSDLLLNILENVLDFVEDNEYMLSEKTILLANELKKWIDSTTRFIISRLEFRLEKIMDRIYDDLGVPVYIFIDEANGFVLYQEIRDKMKTFASNEAAMGRWRFVIVISDKAYLELFGKKVGKNDKNKDVREDKAFIDRFPLHVEVGYLSDKSSMELIKKRLKYAITGEKTDEYYPFTKEAVETIIKESAGVPRDIIKNLRVSLIEAIDMNKIPITPRFAEKIINSEGSKVDKNILTKFKNNSGEIIINLLAESTRGVSVTDLSATLGISRQGVYKWLRKMMEEGIITSHKVGKTRLFVLAEKGREERERENRKKTLEDFS